MKRTPLKRKTPMKRTPFKVMAKRTVTRKKGEKSLAKLKKDLDAVFSKYIRLIYPARCYTCGRVKRRKNLQCGHFVRRQYLATRWDVRNCRPQCYGCNAYGDGMTLDFEEKLKKEYGNDVVEEMKADRHLIIILDRPWYLEQIAHYKQKVKELES